MEFCETLEMQRSTERERERGHKFDEVEQRTDLTELRCPRSSGGSFRSLTASITADRRSTIFFSGFADLVDDGDDEEDEARLSLPWPTARGGFSAVDRIRDASGSTSSATTIVSGPHLYCIVRQFN